KSHIVLGIAPVAIIDRQLPFEYTITSRSTDVVVMALPVQNINHSAFRSMFEREKLSGNNFNDWFRQLKLVLRVEKKMYVIEQPLPAAPAANSEANVLLEWNAIYDAYNEVACLILGSMTPELHRQFENSSPYDMIKELKAMFEKQAGVERFDLIQTFHACKQEQGKPVAAYVIQMKGYVDQLERLGYVLPQDVVVGLILNGLTTDFSGFYEKGLPKKAETPQAMMIKGGKIQKANKKPLKAKGKGKANGKGKDKQVYIPKPKNPKPSAKEHPAKDDASTARRCKRNVNASNPGYFGGNDESKNCRKYILTAQFEGVRVYQLRCKSEIYRSLPSAWLLVSLIMEEQYLEWLSQFDDSQDSKTQVYSSCSNECKESYANLKRLYDAQREQLSDASVEIKAYTQGLKKVEAQLVAHQQGQLWYEQKIKFMKIDLDDKTDVLTYHKKLLAKAQKEKDDLEVIVDKWNHSSKNLGKIVNYHMSARDKFGLGYGDYRYSGILSYENEVFQSVFKSNKSDFENPPLNKRLVKTSEMQAVPPPMTGNYLPSGPDIEIDDSQYTYGPEKTQPSESESQTTELDTCNSNISTEPSELVSEPVVNESNVEVQSKVWSDAPIIEEYESDSDDEYVTVQTKGLDTPSFANKQVKTPRENVKNQSTHSQKPKVNNKELGQGFTERACFVCGSFSHLIRDCDYHVKLAKQVELNKQNMSKGNGTRERKPTWNNVQRVNKQNQFVPLAVQTRTGHNPVNTAKASSTKKVSTARQKVNRQTVLTSTILKVNTVKPIVNGVRPANVFHKSHSPSSRPFKRTTDNPHRTLKNKGIIDSGCSRHMTGNKAYLADFQDFNGGPVAFGGSKGYITGKGKIKTGKLDFEDVSFVKELQHFNLFSVSQMCDKKNKVLFTDTECLVLSPDFKLPDENQILLKVPRQNNMYSFNLENIVPLGGLACLIAKATTDESNKWHRRLGHVNFKNLNRLVKGNLVRGLPTKLFLNDHTCVACQKGKQHKASCKAKLVSSISHTLQLLHMDLFGPTSVRSINHKTYCLVITDDFSRFSWTFFLRTKDETSAILKDFIRQIENQLNQKVKTIRCDNGTEFKNRDVIEFCGLKGIKREYSNARTPQQNGVAERKNRTLIEAARTMLADSFLPNTFWAEAVSTACYVLNRVLVTKPHNKTPYELLTDSDYAGANLDRKSTTGGCQFLGRRLITWQCKKQTIVATSTTEAEYVAAASCCGQVLWIQNQMLDYGFNFMNTKIYIDNESTICIVKNPVYHSKTKHIAIRHHFIRDAYEKKLIQVLKIHTNDNVADLLTKAFDFKSKKIGQVVLAWIKSKNSLVKHFEDMRLNYVIFDNKGVAYHWSGVYQLEVMLVNALRRFRESLRRVTDGAEAFLILTLFILCLDKVSTDHAKLVPLGQVCTAKETLEKNTAKGTKCKLERFL
ncbi:putative ribonuclease H-like domain-containing protein, partial [Tanacetum coccineum]